MPAEMQRRIFLQRAGAVGAAAALGPVLAACGAPGGNSAKAGKGEDIKIGFMTAFTGLETILGQTQWLSYKLAADQINAAGGIAGSRIRTVREDDASDSKQTIDKANKLALQDRVTAIVGLITSLEREAALTVLPKHKTPLVYTTYYEGSYLGAHACGQYYVGLGQVPNQQIDPFVPWLSDHVGKSYYIIGSDYIWPRGTSVRLKQLVKDAGGTVVGERYAPFGTNDFSRVFRELESRKPDICWVTLAGADFVTFLSQYAQFGAKPKLVSIGMDDVFAHENPKAAAGVIGSQNYFMSIKNPANTKFLKAYHDAYGPDAPVNAMGVTAYNSIWLIKKAIEHVGGSLDPNKWVPALGKVSFDGPSGTVHVNAANQHLASANYIGEVQKDGSISILSQTADVEPIVQGCSVAS
jgi:ABC-type branched-subunit amino acid transport system substrate-binding protein